MKIRPVILCGGAGTRLWPNQKNHQAKQFIDFGGWTLMQKTLERIKNSIFDYPIISTNSKYLKQVRSALKKNKFKKYKIVLEPAKKNTAPAILASALIKDIPLKQPLMFFAADHLIEKSSILNKSINKNKHNLNDKNLFIFGIKPTNPSSEYGYFLTKKVKSINKVTRFIEKPKPAKAKQVIKKKGYWNSGMFFLRKDSIINNFKKYQPKTYKSCLASVNKAKYKNIRSFVEKKFDEFLKQRGLHGKGYSKGDYIYFFPTDDKYGYREFKDTVWKGTTKPKGEGIINKIKGWGVKTKGLQKPILDKYDYEGGKITGAYADFARLFDEFREFLHTV